MTAHLRIPLQVGSYLTDEARLVRVLSLGTTDALCEDAGAPEAIPLALSLQDLWRDWRRVWPDST